MPETDATGDGVRWGPDPAEPAITVRMTDLTAVPLAKLLDQVVALRERLGVPVQVLRADRVASWEHLVMAAEHARRAADDGRMRATDPAVEFLLYAAGDRQIGRAVRALGVPPGEAVQVVVVALGGLDPEHVARDLEAVGLPPGVPWDVGDDRAGDSATAAAAWWAERLGGIAPAGVPDALLAHMALLALDRS